jgi:hypothetical protein
MSSPPSFPLDLYRGDTFRLVVRVWEDVLLTIPASLAGTTAKAEIRNAPGGGTVVPFTCTITLPNRIDLFLAAAPSRHLPLSGTWDLQLTLDDDPEADVLTVLGGPVTVIADVTDSSAAAGQPCASVASGGF